MRRFVRNILLVFLAFVLFNGVLFLFAAKSRSSNDQLFIIIFLIIRQLSVSFIIIVLYSYQLSPLAHILHLLLPKLSSHVLYRQSGYLSVVCMWSKSGSISTEEIGVAEDFKEGVDGGKKISSTTRTVHIPALDTRIR